MYFWKTEEEYFCRRGLTLLRIKRSDLPVGSGCRSAPAQPARSVLDSVEHGASLVHQVTALRPLDRR